MKSIKNRSIFSYCEKARITNRGTYHPSTLERFMSFVPRNLSDAECWNWLGTTGKKGYGAFKVGQIEFKAHRVSFEFFIGEIPDELLVCHKCDNPSCVNPNHLFLGTDHDNMKDMVSKDRNKFPDTRGELSKNHKLTDSDVIAIREKYNTGNYTYYRLAEEYKVSFQLVGDVVKNKRWTHLTEAHG